MSDSNLQQQVYESLISALSQTATLHCRGLPCLDDGPQPAVYEGRGANRDVYRIGEGFVLKLCTSESEERHQCNHSEAAALQATRQLPQTPLLYFNGVCAVDGVDSVTLVASVLLVSYGGSSFAKLMHKYFALPYDRTIAEFFVTAYRDLAMMAIEGVDLQIAYGVLQAANVCTVSEPTKYIPGQAVPFVIVGAKKIAPGKYLRCELDRCCDDMLANFRLQCWLAWHPSWHFMSEEIHRHFNCFFANHANEALHDLRERCGDRFRILQRNICDVAMTSPPLNSASPLTATHGLISSRPRQRYASRCIEIHLQVAVVVEEVVSSACEHQRYD